MTSFQRHGYRENNSFIALREAFNRPGSLCFGSNHSSLTAFVVTSHSVKTESWLWLDTDAHDAAMNMAIDEALLHGVTSRGSSLLRVYGWSRPSISIGYFQEFPSDYEDDYDIVRRPTGGGLVWHGKDLTFTFVAPAGSEWYRRSANESYRALHERIARALQKSGIECSLQAGKSTSEMGPCFQLPVAHDIMVGAKKITGGAQRRSKFGLLHQGSLLLPPALRCPLERLKQSLRDGMNVAWTDAALTADEWRLAEQIARDKYSTPAWNRKFTEARRSARRRRGP